LLDCGVPSFAPPTFAVLASGEGTNFEALVLASRRGEFPGRIEVLVADREDAPARDRARRLGVPEMVLPVGRFRTRIEDEGLWRSALAGRGVDALLLAGFQRRLHRTLLDAFPGRVLNIHPSLLPAFPGLAAIRQAFDHGVRVTGCTVHVVGDEIDAGPIVAQAAVEVRDDDTPDTLAARVHAAEHRLYPEAVRRYFGGPHHLAGRRLVPGAARVGAGS
jgi:phosphoribosylglycinamide formyltransferase-1